MRKAAFKRAAHRKVAEILAALNGAFLARARCFFGGGTRIVMELGEYRESKDVDFLCSNTDGYRLLREVVSESSLGAIAGAGLTLVREVRADQYGIRTFVANASTKLKFEIILEGRIEVDGHDIALLPVPCLSRKHCFAEKFLANADRGLDESTLSRDIVDLAFMIEGWSRADADAGLLVAKDAYGGAIERALVAVTARMRQDKVYRNRCVEGLGVAEPKILSTGIKALATLT